MVGMSALRQVPDGHLPQPAYSCTGYLPPNLPPTSIDLQLNEKTFGFDYSNIHFRKAARENQKANQEEYR